MAAGGGVVYWKNWIRLRDVKKHTIKAFWWFKGDLISQWIPNFIFVTRVTRLIHNVGKYLLISIHPLPTHPTHNFTHKNGGNLDTLPGWPKKLHLNRPARCAGQQDATLAASGVKLPVIDKMSASMVAQLFNLDRDMRTRVLTNPSNYNALRSIQNGRHCAGDINIHFLECKLLYFYSNLPGFFSFWLLKFNQSDIFQRWFRECPGA